jgi:N-acetylmuramoyl-L-alanine amidase CwlA
MNIINKKLSLNEFQDYVIKKDFGSYPPTFLVIHHTFSPIEDDHDGKLEAGEWNGQRTIDGLKRYYEGKGWSAGPHLFIADDGIWLFTDMYDVGIHAGEGNGTMKTGYSIGIEVVGDYDKKIWDEETKTNTVGVIKTLLSRLKIPESKIMFHRDYSTKTCPGTAITKDWVIKQLKEDIMEKEFVKVVEKITGKDYGDNLNSKDQIDAAARLKNFNEVKDAALLAVKNLQIQNIEIVNEKLIIESALNSSEGKVAEYSDTIQNQVATINEQTKQITELNAVKNNGVAAMGVIKMFQEAFKLLINFK